MLYAAVPGFYAEIERSRHPGLRDRPVIVGGHPRKRGVVLAATADALGEGIRVGMTTLEALERCPRARILRTDMPYYRQVAKRLRGCLATISEPLEPEGLGAAYLDLNGRVTDAREIAYLARLRVREALGVSLLAGVAPLRFAARLAAEDAGAEQLRVVTCDELAAFLDPLPVARLPGVGPHTAARLAAIDVHRVADILALGREEMERLLGVHGFAIWAAATGQIDAGVRAGRYPRSVSREVTLPPPCSGEAPTPGVVLATLATDVARDLGLEGMRAYRLALRLRFADGGRVTRTRSTGRPLATPRELLAVGEVLLGRADVAERAVRHMGLIATRLERRASGAEQLPLFSVPP